MKTRFHTDRHQRAFLCLLSMMSISVKVTQFTPKYSNYHYIANFSACQNCPIKERCCGNRDRKSLSVTMYYREYERMQARLTSEKGKRLKRRRSAVVEPVFGSLLNYFGMHRTSGKSKTGAHKRMVMAATAYNLKKWLLAKRWLEVVTQVLVLHPGGSFFAFIGRVTPGVLSSQKSCATVTLYLAYLK